MQHLLSLLQGLFHAVCKAAKLRADYPQTLQVSKSHRRMETRKPPPSPLAPPEKCYPGIRINNLPVATPLTSERACTVSGCNKLRGADGCKGRWQLAQVLPGWERTVLHLPIRKTNAGRHQTKAELTSLKPKMFSFRCQHFRKEVPDFCSDAQHWNVLEDSLHLGGKLPECLPQPTIMNSSSISFHSLTVVLCAHGLMNCFFTDF